MPVTVVIIDSITPSAFFAYVQWRSNSVASISASVRIADSVANLAIPGSRFTTTLPPPSFVTHFTADCPQAQTGLDQGTKYYCQCEADGVLSEVESFSTLGGIPDYVTTGKQMALYSLYKWLKARFEAVPDSAYTTDHRPAIIDLAYEQALSFPNIVIKDLGLGQGQELGSFRLGATQGRIEQTLVEFMVQDQNSESGDGTQYNDAEKTVRLLRDQLKFALQEMAQVDQSGNVLMSSVPLIDANDSDAETGAYVWHPREEGPMAWTETFVSGNSDQPNLKCYRVTAKIKWFWIEEATN